MAKMVRGEKRLNPRGRLSVREMGSRFEDSF